MYVLRRLINKYNVLYLKLTLNFYYSTQYILPFKKSLEFSLYELQKIYIWIQIYFNKSEIYEASKFN